MRNTIIGASLLLAACTTVSNGPMQRINVDSDPRGAAVEVKRCGAAATKRATTPSIVWVSRRSTQCSLVFRMPYYEAQTVRLTRHVSSRMGSYADGADIFLDTNGTTPGTLFVGTLLLVPSLAVDAASGSMFELQPHEIVARLVSMNQDWREKP